MELLIGIVIAMVVGFKAGQLFERRKRHNEQEAERANELYGGSSSIKEK